ncbi:DUF3313 domain-containing protein [Rhizobium sp. WSM1325]|uniref:DUF3313 domain-containing protein n=1 Tax=Rhizobium leguminosarum bv. trifolii (strain WSM1325) TaxID=395491 RepID=C6AWS5_RHILS|nr:DUF3313 domain-containing protein [Rhizobium leguminosarum]ACS57972.1 conserved hypothetical protein [Rhizobium leguminosarum bv. trifolii WSM1325]
MIKTLKVGAALMLACSSVAACTAPDPTVYSGLASASQLQPNSEDKTGRVPYRYQTKVNWSQYSRIIVDPVAVYNGPDNQFGKVLEKDKAFLANYMQVQFTEKLKTRFAVVSTPAPATLRLHLTLTGAKATTAVLGTVTRIDVAGGLYNTVQAVRGREGSMIGSVNYAVEIYDAASNRLLSSYVTKQYPNAMNIGASFTAMDASMVGIRKGADALLAELK